MTTQLLPVFESDYDRVGQYNQDAVNGFSEEMLNRMIDLANLSESSSILDAMSGNGNLTLRLYDYCRRRGIATPDIVLLEFSQVQCELARKQLQHTPAKVIWGDILTMEDFESGQTLPDHTFDRVMMKSGNHEIPLEKQIVLYNSIFRILKPGGLFVNLGFLFDDTEERNQFQDLARLKDDLVGMQSAVKNRYFLTRDELYSRLQQIGFVEVQCGMHFHYSIHSSVLVQEYFPENEWEYVHAEIQAQHAKAMILRRKGRIHFQRDSSIMTGPGEITVARRPSANESHTAVHSVYF